MKIKVTLENGNVLEIEKNTSVREVIELIGKENLIALRINGSIADADYQIDKDVYVNFVCIDDRVGRKIYTNGLKYVYILAVKELYGDNALVEMKHSLDKYLYTEIEIGKKVDQKVVDKIKEKMKEIINEDIPFRNVSVSKKDAIDYYEANEEYEKCLNYTYTTNDSVTMYELSDLYNYFYYVMPPSTGILKKFELCYLAPKGILLCSPIKGSIPKFVHREKVLDAFKTYEQKLANLGVRYSGDLNKLVCENKIQDFIITNEILYDENMNDVASYVAKNRRIKAIFISGPSSSGKTTTSKKLALYLKSKGVDSLVISTDDYFVERVDTPRKEDGSYEFECLEALDLKLFNTQMKNLLSGKEVTIPMYNFITGEKEYKRRPTKLAKNQVLIIEGLHAINEKMSTSLEEKTKLKIYISPFTPIGLDRHNHISTTDLRLLRRMVRDYRTRGYLPEATLEQWVGMRESEEKYVYPYQSEADIIINTSLAYEIGVLRTYAEPLLYSVNKDSDNYEEAMRIVSFLKGFINIPSEGVPTTSVLREFIGNSYFE